MDIEAVNECDGSTYEAYCLNFLNDSNDPLCVAAATTAKRDASLSEGEYDATDGALRVYGLSVMGGADSDYFVEDPSAPLSFTYSSATGNALLEGRVYCRENSGQWFDVFATFEGGQVASEWLDEDPNHALMINDDPQQEGYQLCDINQDEITVFTMAENSVLIGGGDLNGFLELDHMPVSLNKRFQLGEGANNHNCENGFGGWFKWSGTINGSEMSGLSGDFVCDLGDCTQGNNDPCGDAVSFSISAFDPDCGRLLTETFTVSREDTTPPFITEGPADVTVDCDDVPEMAGSDAITASDNCGEPVSISEGAEVRFDGSCPNEYFLQRRWTVTDYCGNESIWEQIVTVHDVTAPEVTAATDQTVECDGMGNLDALNTWLDSNGGATATDACSGVIWSNDFTGLSDDCGTTGSATVTFTATDECGNNSSVHATFTIEDTMAPVFDAYTLTTIVECNEGDSDDPSYLPLTAQDECSDVTYTVESMCMSGGCLWTVMRIWTATDDCGNSTTVEQYLMVSDSTAPEVTAPADYIVSADGLDCSADISEAVAGSPEYSDNCGDTDCWGMSSLTVAYTDSDWTYTCNADDDNAEGTRTLIRTWSVTDNCGNVGYAEQTITVVDDTAPMGSVADDSVACAAYDAATEYGSTMESDNCDSDVVVSWEETAIVNVEGGGCYQVERTYTWTDDCDNSMSAVQTITVYDDVAPEITGDIEIAIECSEYPDNNIYIDATDDCGGVNITYLDTEVSGGCVQPEGMYLRTYTVTDECGNSSMFEQFLRLVDTTAPVLTIPADYTIECDQAIVYDDASAEDNCDGDVAVELVVEIVEGDCSQNYQIKRTWTATDDCDNESMATQTITVQDTTAPMLSIPADYTAECD